MQHCACGVMGPSAASMTWLKLAIAANTSMENDPAQMTTATILTLCVQSPEVMNTRTMATRRQKSLFRLNFR